MSSHKSMLAFLASHTVAELPARAEGVVSVSTADDFATAFKAIIDAKVSAAPCYDAESKQFIGFVSIKDLVPLALAVHDKSVAEAKKHALASTDALLKEVWAHLQTADKGITLAHLARRNPFVAIEAGATLAALARVLVRLRSTRVRRVAVVAADGSTVLNVVSQLALIRFIASQLNIVDEKEDTVSLPELKQTVGEAECGTYPCVAVDEMTRTYDVLKQLDALDKGGLAVIGAPDNMVIGNVSARDLKLFCANPSVAQFEQPIGKFLQTLRNENVDIPFPVIECSKETTLRKLVFKFSSSKKHRVYVVDNSRQPLGVISLGDLINTLFGGAVEELEKSQSD